MFLDVYLSGADGSRSDVLLSRIEHDVLHCIQVKEVPLSWMPDVKLLQLMPQELILDIYILHALMLEACKTLSLSMMHCFRVDGILLSGALDFKQLQLKQGLAWKQFLDICVPQSAHACCCALSAVCRIASR